MTKLIALDPKNNRTLGTLNNRGEKLIYSGTYIREMEGEHSLPFVMPADIPEANHFSKRGRFLYIDDEKKVEEFIVFNTRTTMDKKKSVTGIAAYTELNTAFIVNPGTYQGTLQEIVGSVLPVKRYQLGRFEDISQKTIHIEEHIGGYAFLVQVAKAFSLEMQVRIELDDGNNFRGRFIDFVKRIGPTSSKVIEFGKDLLDVEITEDTTQITTRLMGIGPVREDGTCLVSYAESEEAFQLWNDEGEHITRIYKPETTDQNMTQERLDQLTEMELNKRIAAVYTYRVEAADIEKEYPNEKVYFGSPLKVKNANFNPALYAEARVIGIRKSIVGTQQKTYTIGEVKTHSADEIRRTFRQLQAQYNLRVIRSADRPPGNSNKIWVEIMVDENGLPTGMEVPHVWSAQLNDWVKIAPSTAEEIGAEPKIPSGPLPPSHPKIGDKWVDTSGEIAELKIWSGTNWDAVQGPPGKDGSTPVKGTDYFDGKDGQDGTDGTSSFLWIRYSQHANGSNMVTDPANAKYIGVATTETASAPTTAAAYKWALIKGTDGLPGEAGDDGRTSYLHIKYSNDGGVTFTANNGETVGDWIGTYVDFVAADSNSVSAYTWNKVKGEPGVTTYTWIKYADDKNGNGMSDFPEGKRFLGLALNKTTEAESNNAADYKWSPLYDNVVVGGRNYLRNSGEFKDLTNWASYASIDSVKVQNNRIVITTGPTGSPRYRNTTSIPLAKDSEEYTISVEYVSTKLISISGKSSAFVGGVDENGAQNIGSVTHLETIDLGNDRKRSIFRWKTLPEGPTLKSSWLYLVMSTSSVYEIINIQVEKGNIATDWTAAPEDNEGLYTWIRYATTINGAGISTNPSGKDYIGIAYNKDTPNGTENPADYSWSLFRGEQGVQGPKGPNIVDETTPIKPKVIKFEHLDVETLAAISAVFSSDLNGTIQVDRGRLIFTDASGGDAVLYSREGVDFVGGDPYASPVLLVQYGKDDDYNAEIVTQDTRAVIIRKKNGALGELRAGTIDINGGSYRVGPNGIPTTNKPETGYMAAETVNAGVTVNSGFAGVNFRTKKTYTPASITYTTIDSNINPNFYDISVDGFMIGLPVNRASNQYYFRGKYTA